ncbi:unnamed protein product, partial [Owenia fusiformis]
YFQNKVFLLHLAIVTSLCVIGNGAPTASAKPVSVTKSISVTTDEPIKEYTKDDKAKGEPASPLQSAYFAEIQKSMRALPNENNIKLAMGYCFLRQCSHLLKCSNMILGYEIWKAQNIRPVTLLTSVGPLTAYCSNGDCSTVIEDYERWREENGYGVDGGRWG